MAPNSHRWAILLLVTLAHGLGAMSALAVAPLAPFLLEALNLSRVEVGFLLPALYLGGVIMSLPSGWLTDRLGVRLTLVLGQLSTGVMIVLASTAERLLPLLAILFVGGFGMSVINPTTGKAVVEWFPLKERGLAMGIKQTGFTLGGVLGALTLPPLALTLGWRRALLAAGAVSVVSAVLVAILYRTPAEGPTAEPAHRPRISEITSFLKRPDVLTVFGCGLLLSMAQSSVLAYLTLYAKEALLVSVVAAGQLLALAHIGGTAGRLSWGFASDRFFGGRRRPGVVINSLIAAAAYAALAFSGQLSPGAAALASLVVGVGGLGWVGLYFALVAEIGGARYAGLLTGAAAAFAWTGVLMGPPLFGLTREWSGTYRLPWLLLAGLALLAAVLLWRLPSLGRQAQSSAS